jgi:hypothetical protein
MILGYIDVFWRTVPLNGMFMAAHSTTAGAVVLLAIAMMLSEEGAHKYMVRYIPFIVFRPNCPLTVVCPSRLMLLNISSLSPALLLGGSFCS